MKKSFVLAACCILSSYGLVYAEDKSKKQVQLPKYSVEITIKDIPQGQQTLFIPIKLDTMILDFDKVALDGLSGQNILAVASSSKDKVGPGIGLLKLDENGLPATLTLKAYLKPISQGETSVSLLKVADEDALPSRGAVINEEVSAAIKSPNEIEVTETVENKKKKLTLNQNKITISVHRASQKEESIFIPFIFGTDSASVDLDETFGHAIVAPGISAKSFSSGSLHEGGAGVEILLTDVAPADFELDVDLLPKKAGKSTISLAFPQKGHTAIVKGPQVEIIPNTLSVANK